MKSFARGKTVFESKGGGVKAPLEPSTGVPSVTCSEDSKPKCGALDTSTSSCDKRSAEHELQRSSREFKPKEISAASLISLRLVLLRSEYVASLCKTTGVARPSCHSCPCVSCYEQTLPSSLDSRSRRNTSTTILRVWTPHQRAPLQGASISGS